VQKLCEGNRIDSIVRLSRVWLIPKGTQFTATYISKMYHIVFMLLKMSLVAIYLIKEANRCKSG